MPSQTARRFLAGSTAAAVVLLMSLPALAAPITLFTAEDFYIPRPASASDQVGVRRLLITYDLAANGYGDLVGEECLFTVSAFNGDSVHLDNFAVIATGASETDVYGTESQPNVETTTLEDATHVLGSTIEFYNVMLPDADGLIGTSVDFVVSVDCEFDTTTTQPTTPTTSPTTSPTTPPTTPPTTTPPPTTPPPSVSSTTVVPPPSVSSTTVTTLPPVVATTLPFTGPPIEAAGLAMAAAALLLLGSGVLVAIRQR